MLECKVVEKMPTHAAQGQFLCVSLTLQKYTVSYAQRKIMLHLRPETRCVEFFGHRTFQLCTRHSTDGLPRLADIDPALLLLHPQGCVKV